MIGFRNCLALTLLTALQLGASAQSLPYLADVLDKPAYKASFDKMLKGQKGAPWVQTFRATKNGVGSPGESKPIGGVLFEEYDVCEPHNCGGNFLFVIFKPGGRQAFGLLIADGRTVQYYGNPPGGVRQVLDRAAALQR